MRFAFILTFIAACGGSKDVIETTPPPGDPPPPVATTPPDAGVVAVAPPDAAPEPPPPPPEDPKVAIARAEQEAWAAAKPVFDKHCARCHTQTGAKKKKSALKHFDMTTYPFGGHHAGELGEEIREVLGVDGKKATMPADERGAVQGEELDLVVKWSKAFEAAHAAGLHEHHGGHGGH